ncbi:hypothetical protein Tco_0201201 [Tanacetum coccineum]
MAFRGNTRDLGSFREEADEITDLHQILEEVLLTERGDGVAGIKRRRRDLSSDGVRRFSDDVRTCSFHGLRSEDPNQHLKDFLKLVDSLDLDGENRERTHYTTQMSIDYAAGGRLRKLRPDEAWATIERLAQYEDEGLNDTFIPDEVSLNYENLDIKQLLGIMERKVDALMKDAILLMRRSESIFRMTTNKMY